MWLLDVFLAAGSFNSDSQVIQSIKWVWALSFSCVHLGFFFYSDRIGLCFWVFYPILILYTSRKFSKVVFFEYLK